MASVSTCGAPAVDAAGLPAAVEPARAVVDVAAVVEVGPLAADTVVPIWGLTSAVSSAADTTAPLAGPMSRVRQEATASATRGSRRTASAHPAVAPTEAHAPARKNAP